MTAPLLAVQLYTLRHELERDPRGTLERVAEAGFTAVEPFRLLDHADLLADALPAFGLVAPTAHCRVVDADDVDAVLEVAVALGVGTVVDPRIHGVDWRDEQAVVEAGRRLGAVAAQAAERGVAIGYHNHAEELVEVAPGRTGLAVLADAAPEAVLEVDTYWVAVGGQDPVATVRDLGDRVVALHVKDGPVTAEVLDQVAVGRGSMPVREILGAAPHALRVVELDDTRGDAFEAVRDSLTFLRTEGLA